MSLLLYIIQMWGKTIHHIFAYTYRVAELHWRAELLYLVQLLEGLALCLES